MEAGRNQALSADISQNRSVDAFMRHLEHGMSDTMGVTKVREVGRQFLTRISAMAERTMNDMLGITASSLSEKDHSALSRMVLGRATQEDIARLDTSGFRT